MTENNDKMRIEVQVDSSTLEEKIKENLELKTEVEQLRSDLELIASKELQRQAKILGCEATVEAVKEAQLNRSSTATLNQYQVSGGNTSDGGWDSTEDMVLDLNKASKEGNKKATELINKLGKKVLQKPINIELESSIKNLARKPIKSSSEKQEDYELRLNEYKKQQKWRDLNSVLTMGDDV